MNQNYFTKSVAHLFHFMLLFGINRFFLLAESETTIKARVGWPDDGSPNYEEEDDVQEIEWDVQSFSNIAEVLALITLIRDMNLISIDKVIISPEELFEKVQQSLNWDKQRFDLALDTLLNFKVDMIDEGRKSDYFFVHF